MQSNKKDASGKVVSKHEIIDQYVCMYVCRLLVHVHCICKWYAGFFDDRLAHINTIPETLVLEISCG